MRMYNAISNLKGYGSLAIHSSAEVIAYGDERI